MNNKENGKIVSESENAVKKVGQSDKDREVGGGGWEERSGQKLAAYVEVILTLIFPKARP